MDKKRRLVRRLRHLGKALLRDVFSLMAELAPPGVQALKHTRRILKPPKQTRAVYVPKYGPQILAIDPATGISDINFRFYLPAVFGSQVQIRGSFTGEKWQALQPCAAEPGMWEFLAVDVEPGAYYEYSYLAPGSPEPLVVTDPMAYGYTKHFYENDEQFDLFSLVPNLAYDPRHPNPSSNQALCILECTLSGLLARWSHRQYFPTTRSQRSLAERIRASGLIQRLRELNFNAVMFPLQASVADLINYNWKFNYLVTGLGAIDSDIGDWNEFKELVDMFHQEGILVIPDLILVHIVKGASPRAIDNIYVPEQGHLWFDADPALHVDYGTWMMNLADPVIRGHLVELVLRFVSELHLSAFRFDFVDGLIKQYENRTGEYGVLFVQELSRALEERAPKVLCISEAFETRSHPAVLRLASLMYQPWIGFDTLEELTTWPEHQPKISSNRIVTALKGSTGAGQPRLGLGYELSHDEAGVDPRVIHNRKNRFGECVAAGAQLAQLLLNAAHHEQLLAQLSSAALLDHVANRMLLVSATTMFGSDFAYMSLGVFQDFVKLGVYGETDGWQTVWSVDQHPDLNAWMEATGLSLDEVRQRIAAHAERMAALRKLYIQRTPIEFDTRQPLVKLDCLYHDRDDATLVVARRHQSERRKALLLAFNYSLTPARPITLSLRSDLPAKWRKVLCAPSGEPPWMSLTPPILDLSQPRRIKFTLPGNSLVILESVKG